MKQASPRVVNAALYLCMAIGFLAYTSAARATIDAYIPATSPLTLRDGTAVADLISFEPSPADALWHAYPANDHMAGQSALQVEVFVESLVGADAEFLFGVDNLVENSNRTFGGVEFNVLAYHYANKEMVFYYETAISDFTIGDVTMASDFDVDQDLSNLRVYSIQGGGDPRTTDADAPGVIALLSMGLLGLFFERRRR
jgi:hypothetical protein